MTFPSLDDDGLGFTPVPVRPRHDGWTAERQRIFIATLAASGCIADACEAADVTPRSAYRLRAHPAAASFVSAWDRALLVATGRLTSIAFDRAIRGGTREYWKDGECVAEVRAPSNKLLMFLLARLDSRRFGAFSGMALASEDPLVAARTGAAAALDALGDIDCAVERLSPDNYRTSALTDRDGLPRDDD